LEAPVFAKFAAGAEIDIALGAGVAVEALVATVVGDVETLGPALGRL
jgi:hypothetical protein